MAENLIEQFGTEFIWEKGDIKGYPVAIVERMLERQVEQGNERNVRVFERDRWAGKERAGFDWSKSKEGNDFWSPIIANQNFKGYFRKYPNENKSKFKGDIKGLPEGLVNLMLDEQERAGNTRDVSVFEENRRQDSYNGGFTWGDSVDGSDFWGDILNDRKVYRFFEKYPSAIASEEVEVKEEVKEEVKYTTIDEFIAYNQSELQDMEKNNPPVFDALNDVLAELRVAYEGAKPVKKKKKTVKKKTPKPKAVEEDIDLDSLMDDMDDSCELVIDDILCEIDDFELD